MDENHFLYFFLSLREYLEFDHSRANVNICHLAIGKYYSLDQELL